MTMTVTLNRERRTVDQPRYRRDDFLAMFQDISLKAFDLWRTVPGALDEKVEGEWVEVFPGAHFFTAPRYINASAARRNGGGMSNEEIKQAAERVVLLERRIICLAEMLKGADGATAYDVGQWGIGLTVMDIEALIASANAAKASLLAYAPAGGVTITEAMVQDGAEALREWWGNDHYTDEYWTDQARVVLKAAFAEGDADAK